MLLEQPSQYLSPSKGCDELVTASLTESSAVFVIHLTKNFNVLFLCYSSLFTQKKTSVTGQQLAFWLLRDLLFSLFWGGYITPFWWVLLFQYSAVVPKIAQCVVPMQILYILTHFIHYIRTGPLHMFKLFSSWICMSRQPHKVTLGKIIVTVCSHQFKTQGTKTQAKSWLTVLHRTQSIAKIPAKTVNN